MRYKDFEIKLEDDGKNISVYRTEQVEEYIGGGRGHGRGTATGNMVEKINHKGFFSTVEGALWRVVQILSLEKKDYKEVEKLLKDFQNVKFHVDFQINKNHDPVETTPQPD